MRIRRDPRDVNLTCTRMNEEKDIRKDLISFFNKYPATGNKMLMIIVYSLLHKLRDANQELAFDRKTHILQSDIDSIINQVSLKSK